jgi:uncharacterized protein
MRMLCRRHPITSFLVLAYTLSWACWLPLALRGAVVQQGDPWPTHMIGLLGPAAAAVLVTAAADGPRGLRDLWGRTHRWRVPPVWYVVCASTLALGLAVSMLTDANSRWANAASYSGAPNLGLLLTFVLVLLVNGFGEETGWRGFLADRLLPRHGLVVTSLMVAVGWGLWHLPLFFLVESFRGLGLALVGWSFGLACGSLVLTWMYDKAGRSILVVALWHTSYNFASGTALMDGLPAIVTSTAVMILAAAIVLRTHRRTAGGQIDHLSGVSS